MATPALTPPPQVDDQQQPSPAAAPTSPTPAAPAPPKPSPVTDSKMKDMIQAVSLLSSFAKSFPKAAPFVMKMNELAREAMAAAMETAEVGEPAAPPVG